MLARRIGPQSLRTPSRPPLLSLQPNKLLSPLRPLPLKSRPLTTHSLTHDAASALLREQRLRRPVSPHLSIYRPQVTWYLSALNRITGSVLSGAVYVFATAYLVAPLLGWHLESAVLAESFGHLPAAVKGGIKFLVALPFTFHSWNGIRHLGWDLGRLLGKEAVRRSGWVVVGLSVVSSGLLAIL
ncbi:MAG: hypothetical protein M1829_004737 [Trizodia sp. TS-e1964]|nr:MAG: hypothetical protein M1829_004737 [Trizodia sp. TS-e1964]